MGGQEFKSSFVALSGKTIVLSGEEKATDGSVVEPLILMLAPVAPHISEELWAKLGHEDSLAHADWPRYDEQYLGQDTVTAVVAQLEAHGMVTLGEQREITPAVSRRILEAAL